MGLFDYFKKDLETTPSHAQMGLRTHNYRVEYKQARDTLLNYFKKNNINVVNVNDQYGEILVEERAYLVVVMIKKGSVIESSIDFKVTYKTLIGANRPYKLVQDWYRYLDKELRLQSIGN